MSVTERVVMVLVLVWGTQMQYGVAVTTKRLVVQEGQSVEFPCDLRYYTGRDFYWVRVRPDVTVILKRTAGSPLDEFILRNQYRNRTDISLKGPNGTTLQMVVRREDEATNGVYIECQQPQSLQEDKRKTRYELVVTYPPDPPSSLMLNRTSEGLTGSCVPGRSYRGSQRICIKYRQHGTSVSNDGPCFSAVTDGRTLKFEVNDLAPPQSYNVCCIASDEFGEKGTCKNTGPLKSTDQSNGTASTVGICVGVLLVVAILVIAIACYFRKCRGNGDQGDRCKIPTCTCCPCGSGGQRPDHPREEPRRCVCIENCCPINIQQLHLNMTGHDGDEVAKRLATIVKVDNNSVRNGPKKDRVNEEGQFIETEQDQTNKNNEPEEPNPDQLAETDFLLGNGTKLAVNLPDKTPGAVPKSTVHGKAGQDQTNQKNDPEEPSPDLSAKKDALIAKDTRQVSLPDKTTGAIPKTTVHREAATGGKQDRNPSPRKQSTDAGRRRPRRPTEESASGGSNEMDALSHHKLAESTGSGSDAGSTNAATDSTHSLHPILPAPSHAPDVWDGTYTHLAGHLKTHEHLPLLLAEALGLEENIRFEDIVKDVTDQGEEMLRSVLDLWRQSNPRVSPFEIASALEIYGVNDVQHSLVGYLLDHSKRYRKV